MNVKFKKTKLPLADNSGVPIPLTDATINKRYHNLLTTMQEKDISSLIIYGDKEHGGSFEYLVGFVPRFEEGLLIVNADGSNYLILGNENYNKVKYSRIKATGIKCSLFSLPNQPMEDAGELDNILSSIQIDQSKKVGMVGWKLIPNMLNQYDLPEFIVNAVKNNVHNEKLINATSLLISPEYGVRIENNANEIAHYEYGASLASDAVLDAMNSLEVGISELEAGEKLTKHGQYNNVVTIASFGERFVNANLYPTENTLSVGNKVALTTSYRGGLSSRTGYAVTSLTELEEIDPGYFQEVVVPYYQAYIYWLSNIKIGMDAGKFYDDFNDYYPQEKYGWELCPGHLTADDEWLSSPFYKGSTATVKNGMIFQVDFIPSQSPHHGVSAESTIALADQTLREEIKTNYPDLWTRILNRREFLEQELNIHLSDEALPLASTLGYYRPFMLNKEIALSL